MRLRYNLLVIIVLAIFSVAGAQVESPWTKKIKWSADKFSDKNDSRQLNVSTYFIYDQSEFQWYQRGGAHKTEFTITGQSGTWENLENNGQMDFDVIREGNRGKIIIIRKRGQITLSMKFNDLKVGSINYEFDITDFEIY